MAIGFTATATLALVVSGCGGGTETSVDASIARDSGQCPCDVGVSPDSRATAGGDSAAPLGHDGGRSVDSGGLRGDASAMADAAVSDGGPTTLRARICGDRTDWPAPLGADRRATKVGTEDFGRIEGPVWLESGVLLFSDMDDGGGNEFGPPSRIRRLTPPSSFDVWVEMGGSNGHALTNDGRVLAATHDMQTLSLYHPATRARETLALTYMGDAFNSPNDVTVHSNGTIYFTDPNWQLGARSSETGITGVYRVVGTEVTLIDDRLPQPNGIALSPDERTLYVGSVERRIYRYEVGPDGTIGERSTFVELEDGSDGFVVDCAGNLYVTSGGVQVIGPDGTNLGTISVPETTSNVAFGGADRQTLYITAQSGLYSIDLAVPGFPY